MTFVIDSRSSVGELDWVLVQLWRVLVPGVDQQFVPVLRAWLDNHVVNHNAVDDIRIRSNLDVVPDYGLDDPAVLRNITAGADARIFNRRVRSNDRVVSNAKRPDLLVHAFELDVLLVSDQNVLVLDQGLVVDVHSRKNRVALSMNHVDSRLEVYLRVRHPAEIIDAFHLVEVNLVDDDFRLGHVVDELVFELVEVREVFQNADDALVADYVDVAVDQAHRHV
mmetsp:Transcript_39265/g.45033  ORF Transcript_39265/g.45033 Transcript_39265/m.45033 type:complete len:223 (-) Transcript_39265:535-1203(-)